MPRLKFCDTSEARFGRYPEKDNCFVLSIDIFGIEMTFSTHMAVSDDNSWSFSGQNAKKSLSAKVLEHSVSSA